MSTFLNYENSMLFSQSRLEISIVVEVLASMGSNDINILVKGWQQKFACVGIRTPTGNHTHGPVLSVDRQYTMTAITGLDTNRHTSYL